MAVRIEPRAEPIPGYRLLERLGGGGFGDVWKTEAPGGLLKAIKFVFGDLKSAGEENQRAEQELKALARVKAVRHPFILSLERYDIIDGQLMIVMELADRNLWDRYKECRTQGLAGIPREEMLRYMEEIAEALDLMNLQYQLQHLDIKPQNLFLVTDHVKVADFGLAKDLEGTYASVTGGVTPVYAAPETFDGKVSRFCDQYSLAIVYQELLTGRRPFNGVNVRQLILQHLQATPDVSPLPAPDQPVIARALSKAPPDRFPNCRDMVRLLRQNTQQLQSSPTPLIVASGGNGSSPQTLRDTPRSDAAERPREGTPADDHVARDAAPAPSTPNFSDEIDSAPQTTRMILRGSNSDPALSTPTSKGKFKEIKDDGALFPALVLAVGQSGLTVLQRLREILVERFESLEALPNLRMLLLDTDPEAGRQALRGGAPVGDSAPYQSRAALPGGDVLLAGLNRPGYYIKQRDGKVELSSWFNPRMLYRIPRSLVTAGVRALGRLAFCDNYRAVRRRLRQELEACLELQTLTRAALQTQLGVRSNRPRVYILCGLAGGTGSGMFLDLAYTVRSILKELGLEQPDVVGLFLLPPLENHQTRTMALGNTYAALTELKHFGAPENRFRARYLEQEPAVEDGDPPFSRYFMLPLPEETDERANRDLADLAGQFLYRDLCTPLGRQADLARAGLTAPPWAARGHFFHTFGLYDLSWPRRALCRLAGRRLCGRLVERWLSKDSKPLREPIQQWVRQTWDQLGLAAERLITRLRDDCQQRLGKAPETIFMGLLEPLQRKATMSPATPRWGAASVELNAEEVRATLGLFEEWLGRPKDEMSSDAPGKIIEAIKQEVEATAGKFTQQLAELSVRLIEEPAYRLAGAEEAVRQLIAQVEQVLQHQDPLIKELTGQAEQAYALLETLADPSLSGKRRASLSAREVVDLFRQYAKNRLHSQMLLQISTAFVSLRGHLSDDLREINFCRARLTELLRQLDNGGGVKEQGLASGKQLFSSGHANLGEAVQAFLARVNPEVLLDLDVRMEEMLKQKFTALVNICLNSNNLLKNVEQAMLELGQLFADELLEENDVARLLLDREPEPERRVEQVRQLFEEATPELPPPRTVHSESMTLLAAPAGEAGASFRELAETVLSDVEVQSAGSAEDIVFYRELVHQPLAELPHLGQAAQLAYRQMNNTGNFTPHTRLDINFGSNREP